MRSAARMSGARRWKTRDRFPRPAGSGCRARRVSQGSREDWASRDCNGHQPDDAGGGTLDADGGTVTFLPVNVSAGGIDRRVSLSFFGGGCGSSPLQPANNASGDSAQCSLTPPGRCTVFSTVVFSIALSTARPIVFWPRLSLSGAQSLLKRVGAYGTGDAPP